MNAIVRKFIPILVVLFGIGLSVANAATPVPIYGEDSKPVGLTEDAAQSIVGVLTIMIFVLMAAELCTPEVLLLSALIICLLLQILTLPEALSGFSNESMITIGALFIVVGAVEKSHVVDWLARKTFGTGGSQLQGIIRMLCTCFALSIFFNNTPLVAMLMPVVKDWGRMQNISASQLLMPLSYTVLAGSFISMIGTSTNLTVQGLMQADRGYSFSFFAPAPFGIVNFIALTIYQIIAAPYILPNQQVGLLRTARDKAETMMAEIYVGKECKAIGKPVGEVMNSLGVAPSCVIKIRRRVNYTSGLTGSVSVDELNRASTMHKSSSIGNILDMNYIREHARAWRSSLSGKNYAEASGSDDQTKRSDDGHDEDVEYVDIIAPSYHEIVGPHDVLFVSSAQDIVAKMMKSIAGESKGLRLLKSNALALPGFGTELLECVVSDTNEFLGMKVSEMAGPFAEKYKAALITVRGKDWDIFHHETVSAKASAEESKTDSVVVDVESGPVKEVEMTEQNSRNPEYSSINAAGNETGSDDFQMGEGRESVHSKSDGRSTPANAETASFMQNNPNLSVSDHVLGYGDIILCVTNGKEVDNMTNSKEFFVVSSVGALPKPLTFFKTIPVVIFGAMLIIVATEQIDMCSASLTCAVVFLLGGWVKTKEIPKLVDVNLLLLIGSSISFAKAVTTTGLALRVAEGMSSTNGGPLSMLFLVYALTLVITELISNNAAAALMYPIAVALADQMNVSFKPFAMCVLLSSTAGFMSPIGYQTHMMVWGPGGYKFKDFLLYGIAPDIIYWVISCLLIPVVIPFNE